MANSEEEKKKTKADILIEFLEVAFHEILYYCDIYPKEIFQMKKKYQVPIHVSIHPEVNSYIKECLLTAQKLLEWDALREMELVIFTDADAPLEKFCFDLTNTASGDSDQFFIRAEEAFRAYLLKLSVAELKELPDDCKFRIQIITREDSLVRLSDSVDQAHFPWLETDKNFDADPDFQILPMKTLETDFLSLNMYVER